MPIRASGLNHSFARGFAAISTWLVVCRFWRAPPLILFSLRVMLALLIALCRALLVCQARGCFHIATGRLLISPFLGIPRWHCIAGATPPLGSVVFRFQLLEERSKVVHCGKSSLSLLGCPISGMRRCGVDTEWRLFLEQSSMTNLPFDGARLLRKQLPGVKVLYQECMLGLVGILSTRLYNECFEYTLRPTSLQNFIPTSTHGSWRHLTLPAQDTSFNALTLQLRDLFAASLHC